MSQIVPRHPQFWQQHPDLLYRWNNRHPNWQIGLGCIGMGDDTGESTGMYIAAGLGLLLFFTPVGKRLIKAFKGD